MLALVVLQVLQAGQQQPGIAHQRATELEGHARQPVGTPLRQAVEQRLHQRFRRGRRLVVVADAQTAAQVQMPDGDALGFQLIHQGQHPIQRRQERRALGDLRADVAVDAVDLQVGQGGRLTIGCQRLTVRDAELVFLQPGGNVGVRGGVHVRVDAQRHGGTLAHLAGNLVDALQLGQRLHVEAGDVGCQGLADLVARLAHAREHDLARVAAGCDDPRQLAARHHVEAGPQLGKQSQDGQVGIGLHGKADAGVTPGQGLGKALPGRLDGLPAVDVEGRAVFAGQCQQTETTRQQLALGIARQPAVGGIEGRVGRAHSRFPFRGEVAASVP